MKMIRNILRVCAYLSLLLAVVLLALNVTSFFYLPERHSKTFDTSRDKAGIALQSSDDVLAKLSELSQIRGEGDVKRLTEFFAAGVMHYWPSPDALDREILTDFRENWVTATIERLELYRLNSGQDINPDYVLRERLNYENIVAKGVGICSQVALGVADFVRQHGVSAYVWGLDGHVVAVVGPLEDSQTYIVDSDYGVYVPLKPSEIEKDPSLITPSYLSAGYGLSQIETLIDIYGPEGNFEYGTELSWKIVVLQWAVPIALIFVAIVLFACSRLRRLRSSS